MHTSVMMNRQLGMMDVPVVPLTSCSPADACDDVAQRCLGLRHAVDHVVSQSHVGHCSELPEGVGSHAGVPLQVVQGIHRLLSVVQDEVSQRDPHLHGGVL